MAHLSVFNPLRSSGALTLHDGIRGLLNGVSYSWTQIGASKYTMLADTEVLADQLKALEDCLDRVELATQVKDVADLGLIDDDPASQLRWMLLKEGAIRSKSIDLARPAGGRMQSYPTAKAAIDDLVQGIKETATWQFEHDGKWEYFPEGVAVRIGAARVADKASLEVLHEGDAWTIDFENMRETSSFRPAAGTARGGRDDSLESTTRSIRHCIGPADLHRDGELRIQLFEKYKGSEVFASLDRGSRWRLQVVGKHGGWSSGGALAGTYVSNDDGYGQRRAFIKRDVSFEPQIAEILASRLMNDVLPGSAATTELVVPIAQREKGNWLDVYVASLYHPELAHVMSDHPVVKQAYGGEFQPVKYVTSVKRGRDELMKAYGDCKSLCDLTHLRKALIGNLLLANNDMHLGNMILYGKPEATLLVQAFDFGAAFNFDEGVAANMRVAWDAKFRGAIKTESCNHLRNYPKQWTFDSEDFWREVTLLGDFSQDIFKHVFDYLEMYYGCDTLNMFLKQRCKLGTHSQGLPTLSQETLLSIYIRQFETIMRSRLAFFKAEAEELKLSRSEVRI